FTNSAFTNNREYAVIDRAPADVSEVAGIFQADWNQAAYKPVAPNLVVSPDNSRRKLLDLIDSAKHTLVMQCEVIGDQAIADHLGARAKAGVDIRVMLSNMAGKQGNGASTNEAERKQLAAAGITQVAFMKSRVMHAKTIEVDGTRAFIGSENMTTNSLDHNRELGILVQDPTLLSQLDTVLKKDWSQG
ncbi:MAG TPA: phospholipase D-like domain-containing protein, partial [Stenomitos sp.]